MSGVEETTDQQLVDQVMAGNKNAFNLLVMRYQHRVAALIAPFVQDPQEVEDVAQEAFIKETNRMYIEGKRLQEIMPVCIRHHIMTLVIYDDKKRWAPRWPPASASTCTPCTTSRVK